MPGLMLLRHIEFNDIHSYLYDCINDQLILDRSFARSQYVLRSLGILASWVNKKTQYCHALMPARTQLLST